MGFLSSIFGNNAAKQDKIVEMITNGGIVVDVRSPQEFKMGHVKGSKNIPLNTINNKVKDLKKLNKPLILCCASGARSGQATSILKNAGLDVINAGSWHTLAN